MDKEARRKLLEQVKEFDNMKGDLGKQMIENARFLKGDLSGWYNALTAVCFTVGGIAITIASESPISDSIANPHHYWIGAVLLITNGVLIFFLKKLNIEAEFNDTYKIRETEADLWQSKKTLEEALSGDPSRVQAFMVMRDRINSEYDKTVQKWPWWRWIWKVFIASQTDIVFALLLFPIALMMTQVIQHFSISIYQYNTVLVILVILYAIYYIFQCTKTVRYFRKMQKAEKRINSEVNKKSR